MLFQNLLNETRDYLKNCSFSSIFQTSQIQLKQVATAMITQLYLTIFPPLLFQPSNYFHATQVFSHL